MQYLILIVLPLLMYALVIRPQSKRIRAQAKLVGQLSVGDEVISSAGIFGCITALTDDVATLLVAPGVELRVARAAIAQRVTVELLPDPAHRPVEGAQAHATPNEVPLDAPGQPAGTEAAHDHTAVRED